jgi:hypothetical protein
MKLMRRPQSLETGHDTDAFENVTKEEIISLWRCFRSSGLSGDDAWHAIVTGMALDMAFARSKHWPRVQH